MAGVKSKISNESGTIGKEEQVLNADLERLLGEREKMIVGLDKRYLSAYEKIRDSKFGIGIVRAIEGNCKGCNMRIPPQIYNELQKNSEIHTCPSCRRILVYNRDTLGAVPGTKDSATSSGNVSSTAS
jgi:predicted  nucleic acid-binding Zn-ribbon protein